MQPQRESNTSMQRINLRIPFSLFASPFIFIAATCAFFYDVKHHGYEEYGDACRREHSSYDPGPHHTQGDGTGSAGNSQRNTTKDKGK